MRKFPHFLHLKKFDPIIYKTEHVGGIDRNEKKVQENICVHKTLTQKFKNSNLSCRNSEILDKKIQVLFSTTFTFLQKTNSMVVPSKLPIL